MDTQSLTKHNLAYNNTKIKEVVQYKLKRPQFTQELLKDIVDKFKADGIWPILDTQ